MRWVAGHRAELMVIAIAVLCRLAFWLLATPHYRPISDAGQYDEIARNLANGHGFALHFPQFDLHPTAFRPPLYPALLGGLYAIFGSHVVVGRAMNLVIGCGVVALTLAFTTQLVGRRAGLIAGVLVAIYPQLIVNDVSLLTEPLSLALILAVLILLTKGRWLAAGLACGFLILSRPSAQGVLIVTLAWALWQLGWRKALKLTGVAALVVAPWVFRNWIQIGSPMLVSSNGFNMAAMYSPEARRAGGFVDPAMNPAFASIRLTQFDEAKWQSTLQKIGLDSIRSHPGQVPAVVGRNLLATFEITRPINQTAEEFDGRNLAVRAASLPMFYVITIAGIAGIVSKRRDRRVLLMLGVCGYFLVASLFFVAPPRLRAPFDLMCCIGSALLIARLLDRHGDGEDTCQGSADVLEHPSLPS